MLKDFNGLCGSCITMFIYSVAVTIGHKTGLLLWNKIENKTITK